MIIPNTTGLVQHKLVGGRTAEAFDDARDQAIAGWPANFMLNANSPITKIVVRHGWIVDNLAITYKLASGASVERSHGGSGGAATSVVELKANEVFVAISGRAGPHASYNNMDFLIDVSFIIFNTNTGQTRVEGPFGNGVNVTTGTVFLITKPSAFAGYVYTTGQTGVAGLAVYQLTD